MGSKRADENTHRGSSLQLKEDTISNPPRIASGSVRCLGLVDFKLFLSRLLERASASLSVWFLDYVSRMLTVNVTQHISRCEASRTRVTSRRIIALRTRQSNGCPILDSAYAALFAGDQGAGAAL